MVQGYSQRDANEFKRIFNVPLNQYWHGPMLGFDITGFDADVLKSGNMSPRAAIQQTYGSDAVQLIVRLLGMAA